MKYSKLLPLPAAAAKAGMSESSAKRYIRMGGKRKPKKHQQREYRTRPDPFVDVWAEIRELLERDCGLEAKTIMDWLLAKYPGEFVVGQVRTLRRRIRDWRILEGPERKEVFFAQNIRPGLQSQSDYTWCNSLNVTIGGEPFPHMLFHFMLPYSRWEYVWLCFSESYDTLTHGYLRAAQLLGAVPKEHRTDNLAAAVPIGSDRNIFQKRWVNFLAHFGVIPSANNPGCSNENGAVEKSHDLFKHALDQRLRMRGSRDFADIESYEKYLRQLTNERNQQREERLKDELNVMTPLPSSAWDESKEYSVSVTAFSTVSIDSAIYSVPSRFIGTKLKAIRGFDKIKIYYGRYLVLETGRKDPGGRTINYRHIIFHLMRKPGAFKNYQYRDELFPRLVFRQAYDALNRHLPDKADKEYLKLLHQAALGEETNVALALEELLSAGHIPNSDNVNALCKKFVQVPDVVVATPSLDTYDQLIPQTRKDHGRSDKAV